MLKKYKYHIIIVLVILIIAYFLVKKQKTKPVEEEVKTPALNNSVNTGAGLTNTSNSNDAFPLKIGSKGENVKYLQVALNKINSNFKIAEDGDFGNSTYSKLITTINASSYPVTQIIFTNILQQSRK